MRLICLGAFKSVLPAPWRCLGRIYRKAEDWGMWEEGRRSPIAKVKIGRKRSKFEKRIPSMEETVAVLERMEDPNRLVIETCIATSTRISEVLGLQRKHYDPEHGVISIEQRYHRGDLDEPKTDGSRRKLALGDLDSRFRVWVVEHCPAPDSWIFAQKHDPSKPLWDSGVRDALHEAASLVGCDFTGLGPHSFRRANITWRQEVGGSAIEASKIAGHSEVDMTADYTLVGIERQQELTRAIQERLRVAAEKVEKKRKQQAQPASGSGAGQPGDDFERFMGGLYGNYDATE